MEGLKRHEMRLERNEMPFDKEMVTKGSIRLAFCTTNSKKKSITFLENVRFKIFLACLVMYFSPISPFPLVLYDRFCVIFLSTHVGKKKTYFWLTLNKLGNEKKRTKKKN